MIVCRCRCLWMMRRSLAYDQADKQFFPTLASLSRTGIVPNTEGVRPSDALFISARLDTQVATMLQRLPAGNKRKQGGDWQPLLGQQQEQQRVEAKEKNLPAGCTRGDACRKKHSCCMTGCYAVHPLMRHPMA